MSAAIRAMRIRIRVGDRLIDVFFALAFAALLVAIVVVLRSIAASATLIAVGVGISGVLLQFMATLGSTYALPALQWWLLVTLVVLLAVAVVMRRRSPQRTTRTAAFLLFGTSAGLALAFLASRMLAPGAPGPLTGVGYLIERGSAEDNAKWLNAAAQLASGAPVDAFANVGGPLLLLLTLAATVISSVSDVLYGGVNEVAVSAGTLILSEMLLIVLAPLALAPLAEARIRQGAGAGRRPVPWPFLLLGLAIITAGVTVLLNYGHLTLQYTILILTLWVSTFLVSRTAGHARLVTTFAVIATAEVWFPLNVLAVGLLGAVVFWAIAGLVKGRDRRARGLTLAASVVLLVLMWDFLSSSIRYALGVGADGATAAGGGALRGVMAIDVPTLPLFASPGGTEVVSALVGAITVASVIGAFLLLRGPNRSGRAAVLPFAPIGALVIYTLLITMADYWAVGEGPGYATNKLTYAITVPALAAALPVALLHFDAGQRRMTALRWFVLIGAVVLLVLDTFLPRALVQFKPALWPTTNADPKPYWWPGEVRPTADQPLVTNPIGCIYLPQGAAKPSVLPNGQRAYSCTRLLTGVAGQDVPAASVVQWTLDEWLQNESMWDKYHGYFEQLPPEVRARTLILLDDDANVIGLQSIQQLLDRYPPAPEPVPAS